MPPRPLQRAHHDSLLAYWPGVTPGRLFLANRFSMLNAILTAGALARRCRNQLLIETVADEADLLGLAKVMGGQR